MLREVGRWVLASAALAGAAGCAGKSGDAPTCTAPSYSKDITPLLDRDCNTCHTPGSTLWPLVGYENVRDWSYSIYLDVEGGTMPPLDAGAPLPDHDRTALLQWITCGAPNN
jgi:hypothetical protein